MEAVMVVKIDPTRQALASAISEHGERARQAQAARESVARANDLVEQAQAKHEMAKASLSASRNDLVARALAVASSGAAAGPPISARQARQELADADDALEAAQAALTACRASLGDCEGEVRRAKDRVEAATAPILAGEVDRLLAEATELAVALEAKQAALDFLNLNIPSGSPARQQIALTRPPLPPGVRPPDRSQHPVSAAWREAREALCKDAGAPLP
jgi:hypothetical protein